MATISSQLEIGGRPTGKTVQVLPQPPGKPLHPPMVPATSARPTDSLPSPPAQDNLILTLSGSHVEVFQQLTGLRLEIERYGQTVRLQHARLGDVVLGAQGLTPYSGPPKPTPIPAAPTPAPVPARPVQVAEHWSNQIDDDGVRTVLLHLEKYGSVTEDEVGDLTGGPRSARAFANKLDQYRSGLPFGVDLDTQTGQKTYRKK
ncbi:hypothetical protein IV102_17055 [bacterium]|nr:hypothetical protein [bacterium]